MSRFTLTSGGVQRFSVALACVALWAGPLPAQVFEIGENGEVRTRAGSGPVTWSSPDDAEQPEAPMQWVPAAYRVAIRQIAAANNISPTLLAALVWQESRWHADAVSPAGAVGLTQLMPDTARALGVDPRDPIANLSGGARYLRQQLDRFGGNVEHALAAYNAGPARVQKAGGVPPIPETRAYVASVLARTASLTLQETNQ